MSDRDRETELVLLSISSEKLQSEIEGILNVFGADAADPAKGVGSVSLPAFEILSIAAEVLALRDVRDAAREMIAADRAGRISKRDAAAERLRSLIDAIDDVSSGAVH